MSNAHSRQHGRRQRRHASTFRLEHAALHVQRLPAPAAALRRLSHTGSSRSPAVTRQLAHATLSPIRLYTVWPSGQRTWPTQVPVSNSGDWTTTRPCGSTMPLMPVLAARTRKRPVSTARTLACWKCCHGAADLPYHASFVIV